MLRTIPALFLLAGAASAQTALLRAGGTVRSSGLPIPGATVRATQGGAKLVTTTSDDGRYEFDKLIPGAWTFEVEMFGFAPARREVTLTETQAPLDWTLEVKPFASAAPAAARPAASSAPPAKQAQTPSAAMMRQAQSAPRPGFQNLTLNQNTETQIDATLEAAHAQEPQPDASNANEAFLVNGSVSGGLQSRPEDFFEMRQHGEFDQFRGGMPGQEGFGRPGFGPGGPGEQGGPGGGPPSGGYSRGGMMGGGPPMMGGRGGPGGYSGRGGPSSGGSRGSYSGRSRSGRDSASNMSFGNRSSRGRQGIRGALFFTLGNSAFDARPFSLTGQTVQKASYAQSRFGFVGGGPLSIPKLINSERTFFFFSYFGTRARNPYDAISTLPTALERTGDFSQSLVRGPVQVFDPADRRPFPGNAIPASRLNPAALGLLPYMPLPNQPGNVQNYQYVASTGSNTDNLGLRVMRPITSRDRMNASFNMQSRDSRNAQLYGFRDSINGRGMSVSAGLTHTFPRRIISNLNVTFSRNRTETLPFFAYQSDVASALGIGGVSNDPINWGPPNLNFTNFGGLSDASAVLRRDQTAGFIESISILRSRHTLTAGGGYRRMQLNSRTDQNARGTFTFSGLATSAFNEQNQPLAGTGFDFADFLLGLPQSSSVRFGDSSTWFRGSVYNAFAVDDLRLRSNLSLNLGLRYEFFTPFHEKFGHIANLDIAPGFTAVAPVLPGQAGPYSGVFPAGLIDPDKNNFSPRAGIAWRPIPKKQFQIRAGYGIFQNGSVYNQFPSRMAAQPPFARTATVNTSLVRTLTLQNGFATAPTQTILNTYAVDRGYRVGYAQTWNFSIQQSLPRHLVVELGYLGTKGTRLDIQRQPNRAAPGSPLTAEQRRQIGNAVGFTFDSSEGNSIYHAAQVRFSRRFSRGISGNATYTFGKSIDNASSLGGAGGVVAQNDKDLRAERGISSFNQRHTLNVSYILTSPVAESGGLVRGSGWTLRLLRDWSLSGGLTASSGGLFTARVLGNQSDVGGTGAIGSGRADATGLPVADGAGFFNLAVFTIPPSGRFGNSGRNVIDGPARIALNTSLSRSFRIDERRRLELRIDTRNTTNHVSYTNIGTVVNALTYGLATDTAPMRTMNATLRLRF